MADAPVAEDGSSMKPGKEILDILDAEAEKAAAEAAKAENDAAAAEKADKEADVPLAPMPEGGED